MQPPPRYPPAMLAGGVAELQCLSPNHPHYKASCCEANRQLRTSQPIRIRGVLNSSSLSQLLSSVPGAPSPTPHHSSPTPQPDSARLVHQHTPGSEKLTGHSDSGGNSTAGDEQLLPVLCTDSDRHRFLVCDQAKNVFGSDYHVRVPEARNLCMPISEIRHCVRAWNSSRLLLQLDLFHLSCSRPDTDVDHDSHEKQPLTPAEIRKTLKHLLAAAPCTLLASVLPGVKQSTWVHNLQDALSPFWTWLRTTFLSDYWPLGGAPFSSALVSLDWCATGALLPARYDMADRLLLQVSGHRRVLLLPPDAAFCGLAPFPIIHPYDSYSSPMVALTALSSGQDITPQLRSMQELWPDFEKVHGPGTTLGPGEVLFVPAGWFLHSEMVNPDPIIEIAASQKLFPQQKDRRSISEPDVENCAVIVRLFASPGKSVLQRPALALQLSRHVEEWCAVEVTGEEKLRSLVLDMAQHWRGQQEQQQQQQGFCRQVVSCASEPESRNAAIHEQVASGSKCTNVAHKSPELFADPSGLKGYKLLCLWELCVKHVSAIVGNESGPRFLEQMCDSRLLPTDWLNKMCRDTLVLAEKQFWYDDVRTPHEIKYPELFRMQIQDKDEASKATTLRPARTNKDLFLPWTTASPFALLEQEL